jgi:thioredoxin-like negative regulator of GroEL
LTHPGAYVSVPPMPEREWENLNKSSKDQYLTMGSFCGDQQIFIKKAHSLLDKGLFTEVLDLADQRIARMPGELDAQIIRAHALTGLNHINEAGEVLKYIEEAILRLSSEAGALSRRIHEIETTEKLVEEPQASVSISSEFYTVTLAELYIRQGHLDSAQNVLETILKENPVHETALFKLREVEELLRKNCEKKQRDALIVELNGWLTNVQKLMINGS